MRKWIDFKKLRETLDFEQVLQHYGVVVKRKGEQHQGLCPLPGHGDNRSVSFSANLKKGIFHCFSCGAKGNVLEFAVLMEKLNPANGTELRLVAVKMDKLFGGAEAVPDGKAPSPQKQEKGPPSEQLVYEMPVNANAVVNAPLDFELKGLDNKHPYFQNSGYSQTTVDLFGLGVASRGTLKGRLAIPLHDDNGKLLGYAGRWVGDVEANGAPKYWFPDRREHEGTVHEFQKSLFLYNGFRITKPLTECIIVKGLTAVWWLHQCGIPHVVSTMGPVCSDKQAELMVARVKPTGRIWIMSGDDRSGEDYAASVMLKLSPHRSVRWAKLQDAVSATSLSAEELKKCFKK